MSEILESIAVAEGEQFALFSSEDGSSYRLSSKEDSTSVQIQGDDAPGFIAEFESVKGQYPSYTIDQVLAQLWDQGGYSWMAEPDGA